MADSYTALPGSGAKGLSNMIPGTVFRNMMKDTERFLEESPLRRPGPPQRQLHGVQSHDMGIWHRKRQHGKVEKPSPKFQLCGPYLLEEIIWTLTFSLFLWNGATAPALGSLWGFSKMVEAKTLAECGTYKNLNKRDLGLLLLQECCWPWGINQWTPFHCALHCPKFRLSSSLSTKPATCCMFNNYDRTLFLLYWHAWPCNDKDSEFNNA